MFPQGGLSQDQGFTDPFNTKGNEQQPQDMHDMTNMNMNMNMNNNINMNSNMNNINNMNNMNNYNQGSN